MILRVKESVITWFKNKSKKKSGIKIHTMPHGGFWVDPEEIMSNEKWLCIMNEIAKIPVNSDRGKPECEK